MEIVLYVPQAVKRLMVVSSLMGKGATVEAKKCNMTIRENGVGMNLHTRKGVNGSTIVYLKGGGGYPQMFVTSRDTYKSARRKNVKYNKDDKEN